ncbi:response regulator transcription factor [Thalassoroseus pseudoceratinae]|uniref:response regulator transcription factor n=1 Tax=Thalassoroseus pseudoceratinae TaxID=2713176 RepID=UPI001F115B5C|nr:response regulator transcription factor [Thalassoroseus pseudoceratinae]
MYNENQETVSNASATLPSETTEQPTVFVVDDEDAMRKSLCWLFESVQLKSRAFADAFEFLEFYDPSQPGCLVLDVRMPGMSGLELQEKLQADRIKIPIILLTGYGDVPMAVRGMKAGAVDFLEKPASDEVLLEHVHRALELDRQNRKAQAAYQAIIKRLKSLTPRETEVMEYVVEGQSSKAIAEELKISFKTVEAHRARIMKKMEAQGVPQLIHMRRQVPDEEL